MPSKIYNVRVIPKSSEDKIIEQAEDFIKVKLKAPPVENKANFALIDFLAKELKVKKSQIFLIAGVKSKDKKIRIDY